MNERYVKTLTLLQSYQNGDYTYLGEGQEGIVFTDGREVYKIYDSLSKQKYGYLKSRLENLKDPEHLYKIRDFIAFKDMYIQIYPYEKSSPFDKPSAFDYQKFLAEIWRHKLIVRDIKPENFILVQNTAKLIDYGFRPYTDDLFLNMCVRSFVYVKYYGQEKSLVNKIARSAINNFNLPQLEGAQEFVNGVFSLIIFKESGSVLQSFDYTAEDKSDMVIEMPFTKIGNLDSLFYTFLVKGLYLKKLELKNIRLNAAYYFEPISAWLYFRKIKPFRKTVSLIIKTCPQDYQTIYANVKHIVKQVSSPDVFYEKIVAVDPKEKNFTREFTNKGTLEALLNEINNLIREQVIDRYIVMPADEIVAVNERWFGISSLATHSVKGVPVTPQLFAFEQAKGEYIFQMDSDVMIARKDLSHSFLHDMVSEMENHENAVSVGFNICQDFTLDYKPYFGFEDGGFVPEVRMGLFHKRRFMALRPLRNALDASENWRQTWYRAMHEKQKETGFCSIRGGDSRSFFIHPQNYRKTDVDVWMTILDRVESGYIPDCQQNQFDCAGSYYDWTMPKRNEGLVIICLVRNVEYTRFLRMFCSIISQVYKDWGMIIIDDASTNGLPFFIDAIIKPFSQKITFIKNRIRRGSMANHYKAIHYVVSNPDAIIMTVDGDDALIGKNVFTEIVRKYSIDHADVVIGRVYQNYRLQGHYRYPVNFIDPRLRGGNVWQHPRTFRKYLFDSLDIFDLKKTAQSNNHITNVLSSDWIERCIDFAMMVPIVEMSRNPMQMDYLTYYYERNIPDDAETKKLKENSIADILNKPSKTASSLFKGRKRFLPHLNKVEIDITYECNLKCTACNRSCAQAPTMEQMDREDIKKFIEENISLKKQWEFINILGGEPTLHPDFEHIVRYITESYVKKYSSNTTVQITSNGYTQKTRNLLERVKKQYGVAIDYHSFKVSNRIEYFSPFNDAPVDDERFNDADYTKACWVTGYCGIGLNKFGYYACSVCGGIDRILHDDRVGIPFLKEITIEKLQSQFLQFCKYCGNFKDYEPNQGNFIPRCEKAPLKEQHISKTWKELYKKFRW